MNDIRRNPPKKTDPKENAGAEALEKRGNQRLSVEQLQKWEAMEYGIFLHFGMPTFTGYPPSHYRPPDFGQDSPSLYNPDKLDVDQWISVVRDAGAKYAVLTTKFNDGFCLWPSKLTDYTIANSANKTDIVAAFMEACDKHGIIPGFYYNSNDAQNRLGSRLRSDRQVKDRRTGLPYYTTSLYHDYMANHLTELLTTYGSVAEIWIDLPGELGRPARTYMYNLMAQLSPETAILMNHGRPYTEFDVDYTWPSDLFAIEKATMEDITGLPPESGHDPWQMIEGKEYYMPAELSGPIRADKCWFGGGFVEEVESYKEEQQEEQIYDPNLGPAPISDEALLNLYTACRKRNVNLLLDLGPDRHGLINDLDIEALNKLRKRANI
jgi:alpha-L-fucosidase